MRAFSTVLAALYGGGEGRPGLKSSRHSQILACLRRGIEGDAGPSWDWILSTLRKEGFVTEAVHLMDTRRIAKAEAMLDRREVITVACEHYPQSLVKHLGRLAPPLLWLSDPAMANEPPWKDEHGLDRFGVGGLGCREPLTVGSAMARTTGLWCADRGFFGVSGAALGCDTAFGDGVLSGGGDVVHILPCGMDHGKWLGYAVSVCPPQEPFSAGRAMERNALIYAMAHFTVVCSARFRMGGSWQGAAAAIKNHQALAVVDWTSTGHAASLIEHNQGTYGVAQRALANLGAYRLAVDLATYRAELPYALDDAMSWAYDFRAGVANTGLFAATG